MLVPHRGHQSRRDHHERWNDYLRRHATRLLNCVLDRETNEPHSLASWNDEPRRTHAEILALIDKAIDLEEAHAP